MLGQLYSVNIKGGLGKYQKELIKYMCSPERGFETSVEQLRGVDSHPLFPGWSASKLRNFLDAMERQGIIQRGKAGVYTLLEPYRIFYKSDWEMLHKGLVKLEEEMKETVSDEGGKELSKISRLRSRIESTYLSHFNHTV